MWDKRFSTKNRDTPACAKFFDTRNTEGFPYEFFRYLQTNNFRWKIVIPPFSMVFRYQKFWNTKRAPSRIFSRRQNSFRDLSVIPPPLWFNKICALDKWASPEASRNSTNFCKYQKRCLTNFVVLWDEMFSTFFW